MTDQQLKLGFLSAFPSKFTLGWGDYREQDKGAFIGRFLFNWDATTKCPLKLGCTQITPSFTLRQTSYDEPGSPAYYYFSGTVNAQTKFGPYTNVLTYGKQDAHGFTPFSFDTIYPNETITDSLQYYTAPLRLYLTGGRDLLHGQWQDVTFRADAQLARGVAMHQMVGFDPNNHQWRDLVSQYNFLKTSRFIFNLGTRLRRPAPGWKPCPPRWIGSFPPNGACNGSAPTTAPPIS